jgi:hypothetical protein
LTLAIPAAGSGTARLIPLTQRVLGPGEFPGYVPGGVRVVTSPKTWSKANAFATVADLREVGFVAAALTILRATRRAYATSATSSVVEFGFHRGALTYLLVFVSEYLRVTGVKRFAVPGVPGAYGIANVSTGGGTYDIVFVDGRFFYEVTAFTNDAAKPPSRAQVAAAAARWHGRIHG